MLDHLRVQLCLQSIGGYVKVLVFKPSSNFFNLYEFMNMISFYAENGRGVGSRIATLQYTFPCNMATSRVDESVLYGTGGLYWIVVHSQYVPRVMGPLHNNNYAFTRCTHRHFIFKFEEIFQNFTQTAWYDSMRNIALEGDLTLISPLPVNIRPCDTCVTQESGQYVTRFRLLIHR